MPENLIPSLQKKAAELDSTAEALKSAIAEQNTWFGKRRTEVDGLVSTTVKRRKELDAMAEEKEQLFTELRGQVEKLSREVDAFKEQAAQALNQRLSRCADEMKASVDEHLHSQDSEIKATVEFVKRNLGDMVKELDRANRRFTAKTVLVFIVGFGIAVGLGWLLHWLQTAGVI